MKLLKPDPNAPVLPDNPTMEQVLQYQAEVKAYKAATSARIAERNKIAQRKKQPIL